MSTNHGPGFFSALDSIHAHVDGGGEIAPAEYIVKELRDKGAPGKTTPIIKAVEGPQRKEPWAKGTYYLHTPGLKGQEHLEFFSTTLLAPDLSNMQLAVQNLSQILSLLNEQQSKMPKGIVVEVERVIGKGQDKIEWARRPVDESLIIHSPDAGFTRRRTAEIEIHYAFDIPKRDDWKEKAPLDLTELKEQCEKLNIYVGGWFFFDKGDRWAYRSNQFLQSGMPYKEKTQQQRDRLHGYLQNMGKRRGFQCSVSALVEQILGVWRTPLEVVDTNQRKSVTQLADWEANSDLEDFWVVAPNFLGDVSGEVRQAMVSNLSNRVSYTYFLRSFADLQRLKKFAETLQFEVRGNVDVFALIKAVVLEPRARSEGMIFDEEYFLSNPLSDHPEGFRLLRNRKGEIYEGERMKSADFREIEILKRLIQLTHVTQWIQVPLAQNGGRAKHTVMCAKLEKLSHEGLELSEQDWDKAIDEFDQMIANHVSRHSGRVYKGSLASYFCVFDDVANAIKCAQHLQYEVHHYNRHINIVTMPLPRVTLDYGHIVPVMRSYGFDVSGRPLSICAKLAEQINDGEVVLTSAVEDNLTPIGADKFSFISSGSRPIEEFGNVETKRLDLDSH